MTVQEIIKFLRQSIMVQDPEVATVDEDFLSMTEEDFIITLQISLSKVDPQDSIFNLSRENLYPLILVTKKELYHRLAVKSASDYTLQSATGGTLSKSDVFDHYYTLIEQVEKEYKNYLATGVRVQVGEVLLSSRYFSERNYNLAKPPCIKVLLDNLYSDNAEISWDLTRIDKFAFYEVYVSEKPVVDRYSQTNPIRTTAKKLAQIKNIHQKCFRVDSLKSDTTYYVAILVEERNGLKGFEEIKFTTLAEEGEE